jgi:hypothetical protein
MLNRIWTSLRPPQKAWGAREDAEDKPPVQVPVQDEDVADEEYFDSLRPPPNETKEEKAARLKTALEATRISQRIDAELAELKKIKERSIKVLLLGGSPFF